VLERLRRKPSKREVPSSLHVLFLLAMCDSRPTPRESPLRAISIIVLNTKEGSQTKQAIKQESKQSNNKQTGEEKENKEKFSFKKNQN